MSSFLLYRIFSRAPDFHLVSRNIRMNSNTTADDKHHWSDDEVAFLLNFLDFCHINNLDYKKEISEAISHFSGYKISFSAAYSKISRTVKSISPSISFNEIIRNGTEQLPLQYLPIGIFEAFSTQRKTIGLKDHDIDDRESSSVSLDSITGLEVNQIEVSILLHISMLILTHPADGCFKPRSCSTTRR